MRPSTACLAMTSIRLSELRFPASRVRVGRTRTLFIHLDNLLHFAKVDREGRVDGYVLAFLPDELVFLFLRQGELVSAGEITPAGRAILPIPSALARIRREAERGELMYCDAPFALVAWLYHSCAAPATPRPVESLHPESVFPQLQREAFTGIVELVSNGSVNYVRLDGGQFVDGYFSGKSDDVSTARHFEQLFARDAKGNPPEVAAAVFPDGEDIPRQATPELIQIYRELFWSVARAADQEVGQEAMQHARRLRDLVAKVHGSLTVVGTPLDREASDVVATDRELTAGLAEWAERLLEQVEIVAPGAAPDILRDATRQQRYLLQRAGFYERLPWTVNW
jgi:hypothetical protein